MYTDRRTDKQSNGWAVRYLLLALCRGSKWRKVKTLIYDLPYYYKLRENIIMKNKLSFAKLKKNFCFPCVDFSGSL